METRFAETVKTNRGSKPNNVLYANATKRTRDPPGITLPRLHLGINAPSVKRMVTWINPTPLIHCLLSWLDSKIIIANRTREPRKNSTKKHFRT